MLREVGPEDGGSYRSVPPRISGESLNNKSDTDAPRYRSLPERGALSDRAKKPAQSQQEVDDFNNRQRSNLKNSISQNVLNRNNLQGGVKQSAKNITRSIYQTAVRYGSNELFYWLLGFTIVPPFIFGLIGLNVLLLLALFKVGKVSLAFWQKSVIVVLDLIILLALALIIFASLVYYCNFTLAKLASDYLPDSAPLSSTYSWCKYFKVSGSGISGMFNTTSSSTTSAANGGVSYTYTGIASNHTTAEVEGTRGCTISLAAGRPKDKELAQINEPLFQYIRSICAQAAGAGKKLTISALTGCNGTSSCSGHAAKSFHYRGCAVDFGDDPSSANGQFIISNSSGMRINPGSDADQDYHTHIDLGSNCKETAVLR